MQIRNNYSLKELNTFGIDVSAAHFVDVTDVDQIAQVLTNPDFQDMPRLILGGGSNILFTKDYDGLVIKNSLKGIQLVKEDEDHYWVKSMAGEQWHDLVTYCIDHGYAGIENLSLIPGQVGAAPMQNIGAYGVELKDVFDSLEAINCETQQVEIFNKEQCEFGYRESIFKKSLKGKHLILSITLRLSKVPEFHIGYGAIQDTLEKMHFDELNIKVISDAVIQIRQLKLPDPKELGNAGSFFKNPEIPKSEFLRLKEKYPGIPNYPLPNDRIKIPAGWLIEQCGWKGKVIGNTGSHKNQALVLVNYGNASGDEIYTLAMTIKKSVQDKFHIEITPEVNIA